MKLLVLLVLQSLSPPFIHWPFFLGPPYLALKNAMLLTVVSANFSFSSSLKSFLLLRQALFFLAKHPKSLSCYLKRALSSLSVLWRQETLYFQIQNQSKTNPSALVSNAYCKSHSQYYKTKIWGRVKVFLQFHMLKENFKGLKQKQAGNNER